jgi:hypothetical protein
MVLTSAGNIGDAIKKPCTDKTTLSNFFKNTPEADYGLYTPEDPRNLCTGQILSSDELKKHKDNFCSLKPEHSVCPTTPTPPSPASSPTPTPTPSSPTPSSPTPSSSQNDSVMLLCSGITSLSCIMIIVILVMMKKRSN